MAITRTQAVSANATNVAITSATANDIIVVWSYNSGAATIPTLAGGFTNIVATAGTQQAARLAYKVSTGGETTSGTWTNATQVVCMVYRGCDPVSPFGATPTITAGSSTNITYSGVTVGLPSKSAVIGFAAAKSATTGMANNPTSGTTQFTRRTNQTTVQGCDTVAPIGGNYNAQSLAISPTSRWQCVTIEIELAPVAPTIMDTVPGSFSLTGNSARLLESFELIVALGGNFNLLGASAVASKTYVLAAATGTFVETGNAADMTETVAGTVYHLAGLTGIFIATAAAANAPSSHVLISYTAGSDRNDFTGEVGVRLGIGTSDIPINWIGARRHSSGQTGTHTVRLNEWFTDTVQRTAVIDYTGVAVGDFAWTSVAPMTLTAGGYYALMMEVTAFDGQTWCNPGATAFSGMTNVYDCYRVPASAMATGTPDDMFIGFDLGAGVAAGGAGMITSRLLGGNTGAFIETGNAAREMIARRLAGNVGTFNETGNAARLITSRRLASAGSYSETGNSARLIAARRLAGSRGTFNETGNPAKLFRVYAVAGGSGAYSETGNSARLIRALRLALITGTYSETGNTTRLIARRLLAGARGIFLETGNDAFIIIEVPLAQLTLIAGTGSFLRTGSSASLLAHHALAGSKGTFLETGTAARLLRALKLAGQKGVFNESAGVAALFRLLRLASGSGAFIESGAAAYFVEGINAASSGGVFTESGSPARLLRSRLLQGLEGIYTEVGYDAGMTHSGIIIFADEDICHIDLKLFTAMQIEINPATVCGVRLPIATAVTVTPELESVTCDIDLSLATDVTVDPDL